MKVTDKITITNGDNMGNIKLINGDCFLLNKDIPDESIDLIVTDPPYGMSFQSGFRKVKHGKIENDDDLLWLNDWFKSQYRILKNNSHAYVFCSFHNVDKFKISALEAGFELKNILIWHKNNTGMGDLSGDYAPQYEFILFLNKGRKTLNGRRDSNIVKCARTKNEHHPTEKPVNLMQFLIEKSSNKGDLVLDNFFGSGATAVACHNLGRRFIGHEIDKERFLSAEKRVNQLTKQTTLF